MQLDYFVALIAIATLLSVATADQDLLPKPGVCGRVNQEQFTNRQETTEVDEFPWMARIAYNNTEYKETTYMCLAVLISQRYLLTVAHCLRSYSNEDPYAVVLGDWDNSNDLNTPDCSDDKSRCTTPIQLEIEEIILHPYMNTRKRKNDIALMRLSQPVTYTDYIRPICLPSADIKSKEFGGEQLTITGWYRKQSSAGKKQKKIVTVHNNIDCQRKYPSEITESHMCAIACHNGIDYMSASALMDMHESSDTPNHYYLAGVLSYGRSTCSFPENADVFTRIDRYLDWINENVY